MRNEDVSLTLRITFSFLSAENASSETLFNQFYCPAGRIRSHPSSVDRPYTESSAVTDSALTFAQVAPHDKSHKAEPNSSTHAPLCSGPLLGRANKQLLLLDPACPGGMNSL